MKKQELQTLAELLEKYYSMTGQNTAIELAEKIRHIKVKRSAGRKPVYDFGVHKIILKLRDEGKSIREIADITGCSVGYIHKIIHNMEIVREYKGDS